MQKIDTIIFDLGGVLIDWDPRNLYRKIFAEEGEMEWFLENVCNGPWNHAQDAGRSFAEATELLVPKFPRYEDQIRAFFTRWPEMITGDRPETVAIQQALIKNPKYRVVALTNWSAETFPWALDHFPFLHDFEGILVSGDENLAKPDPAIYQLLLDRYDIDPAKAFFIDDAPKNIAAAWKLGIAGHRYTSAERLEEALGLM
ncbi:MAG: HAD family hydrolase [Bacteroidia bacterium]